MALFNCHIIDAIYSKQSLLQNNFLCMITYLEDVINAVCYRHRPNYLILEFVSSVTMHRLEYLFNYIKIYII